jgi:hypothetical protein
VFDVNSSLLCAWYWGKAKWPWAQSPWEPCVGIPPVWCASNGAFLEAIVSWVHAECGNRIMKFADGHTVSNTPDLF